METKPCPEGKRRRKCNTRIYSITTVIQAKQEKSTFKQNQTTNTRRKLCKQECVLTWHCSNPSANRSPWRPNSSDWHLVRSVVAVCSVFLVLAEISIPLPINLRRRMPRWDGAAVLHIACTFLAKATIPHKIARRKQLVCDIWPRWRFCRCAVRARILADNVFSF